MKFDDALRKISLLRQVRPEYGFSQGEIENAAHMVQGLLRRFSVKPEDVLPAYTPCHRPSWVYWQQLLDDFGLELRRFGKRGSASLGNDRHVVTIRVDTGEWQAQRMSAGGWETLARDYGLDSLRAYLSRNAPRTYSFYNARR
jgi:hypothetical protein